MEAGNTNCQDCANYIRLCSGLDFFPSDVEVRRLLVERLHRSAKNHGHAKAMIERWLDTQTVAPKVVDLIRLAGEVRIEMSNLPKGCEICSGQPFVVTDRGAQRCGCARGEALKAMEVSERGSR
jgi:hypothetical protein